jgi:MoaA/NifB/PqqE/SkfB family radical SAM enzyme
MLSHVLLITTWRCDLKCAHCLQGHPDTRYDFPLDILPQLLTDVRQFGAKHTSLTGGEPHLHPQFNQMINTIAEMGFTWNYATNGQQLEPYKPLLEKYGDQLRGVTLSLDGATAKTHNAIRGHKGAFERVLEAIRFYVDLDLDIKVKTNTCINQVNKDEVEEIIQLGEELGIDEMRFAGVIPAPLNEDLRLTEAENIAFFERLGELNEETEMVVSTTSALYTRGGISFCSIANLRTVFVNAKGEMIFCCDTQGYGAVVGSLYETPLPDLIKKWIGIAADLKSHRTDRIAAGKMGEGFDTCVFCNNYLDGRVG